eukprot:CAMPEP_0115087332 /NCGR_PEP_ID=MMETSP0227-20121206/23196_1 /TAXON_ID=89957 /ORGANISM="Polarella glacialis, Strain CCMP 1383" /LENGTH=109 /DNA_ID=CAMNT_0002477117 /DNA_START=90 /DNA_END=419 /DNA_ORIENTATION=-
MVYTDEMSELTVERLVEAVEHMNSEEIERCLDGGIRVNDPIDKQGHTILDKFAVEHAQMLNHALTVRARPEEATQHFLEMQEAAAQVLKVLHQHGAQLSAQSGHFKRGL